MFIPCVNNHFFFPLLYKSPGSENQLSNCPFELEPELPGFGIELISTDFFSGFGVSGDLFGVSGTFFGADADDVVAFAAAGFMTGFGEPHFPQNLAPARNSVPHFLQNISHSSHLLLPLCFPADSGIRYCYRSHPQSLYM